MAYVERDKAIAYVEEQYRLFKDDEGKQAIVEGCVEALKFTPTVDVVEVVHGEWVLIVERSDYLEPPSCDTAKCSICGRKIDVSETGFKYCPYCGAKMDGGKEKNDRNN